MKDSNTKQASAEKIRIGDLAKILNVEKFIIRFWEREFGIKARRSAGGQRYYTNSDVQRIERIKHLLYNEGLTIAGAKKHLSEKASSKKNVKFEVSGAAKVPETPAMDDQLNTELLALRAHLLKLRTLLLNQ